MRRPPASGPPGWLDAAPTFRAPWKRRHARGGGGATVAVRSYTHSHVFWRMQRTGARQRPARGAVLRRCRSCRRCRGRRVRAQSGSRSPSPCSKAGGRAARQSANARREPAAQEVESAGALADLAPHPATAPKTKAAGAHQLPLLLQQPQLTSVTHPAARLLRQCLLTLRARASPGREVRRHSITFATWSWRGGRPHLDGCPRCPWPRHRRHGPSHRPERERPCRDRCCGGASAAQRCGHGRLPQSCARVWASLSCEVG